MEENVKFEVLETITKTLNKYLNVYYTNWDTYNNFTTGKIEVSLTYDKHKLPLEVDLDIKTLNILNSKDINKYLDIHLLSKVRKLANRSSMKHISKKLDKVYLVIFTGIFHQEIFQEKISKLGVPYKLILDNVIIVKSDKSAKFIFSLIDKAMKECGDPNTPEVMITEVNLTNTAMFMVPEDIEWIAENIQII